MCIPLIHFLLLFTSAQVNPSSYCQQGSDPIITERIDGPANIRDTVNGKLLFSLNDQVPVTCSMPEDGWYRVGLLADTDMEEIGTTVLKVGTPILLEGEIAGEMETDMEVFAINSEHGVKLELTGYTYKGNIHPETIIERALEDYLQTEGETRTESAFGSFIDRFALELVDHFEGLVLYCNDETWLNDPSPMWRLGLVFRNDTLVAVLHSRPFNLPGTTGHKFNRGFDCQTFDDSENTDSIVRVFEEFVNSID